MKKHITLLVLLVSVLSISAQDYQKYYAIDGTAWATEYDRDKKERLLWQKVELDLRSALVVGRLGNEKGKEYHDILQKLFEMCKKSFKTVRSADNGREILQNPEFRYFLKQNGVSVRNGQSRSNETFNFSEYSNCFDSVLREYSFNADIVEQLADPDGRTFNLDFIVNDFSERMEIVVDRIESEISAMGFKEKAILRLTPQFTAKKRDVIIKKRATN